MPSIYSGDVYVFSNQCSDPISDAKTCELAATAYKLSYVYQSATPTLPSGCFKYGSDVVYFNDITTVTTECSDEFQCICTDLNFLTYTLITSGYCSKETGSDGRSLDSLSSAALCTEATTEEVYFEEMMPSGCILSASTQQVVFNAYLLGGYAEKSSDTTIQTLCNADNVFSVVTSDTCTNSISTASDCFSAALNSGFYYKESVVSDEYPYGCSYNSDEGVVYFNEHGSSKTCSVNNFCFCFNARAVADTCNKASYVKGSKCDSCPSDYTSDGLNCVSPICAVGTYIYGSSCECLPQFSLLTNI